MSEILKIWGKKKNIVCCVQGRGLWVSVEKEISQQDLKSRNGDAGIRIISKKGFSGHVVWNSVVVQMD